MYQTSMYEGMLAETIAIPGFQGDLVNAYFARPLGPVPFPAIVVIHHMPGWDEWYREATRRFAHHGYAALSPNLYFRAGDGRRRMWQPKCARRAACRTNRSWGILLERCTICAHSCSAMARSVCLAPVLVVDTPSWQPAGSRVLTQPWTAGADGW